MKRIIFISLFLFLLTAKAAHSAGYPVFDGAALIQQMTHYISMIKQYAMQIQQYYVQSNHYVAQIQQLENDYRNMVNFNWGANLQSLDEMQRIMNRAVGISNDVARMQTRFETLYPDFATYQNQSGASYSQQAAEWAKQNQQSALDTLRVQAAVKRNIEADSNDLKTLSDRSRTASGTKDLLQVANQLHVTQTKQLMHLEQILISTSKADAAYLAEKASKEAAAAARAKRAKQRWKTKGTKIVNPELGQLR